MLVYSTLMFHDVESHVKIGAIQSLLARQIFSLVDIFLIKYTPQRGPVFQSLEHRLLTQKVPSSVLSLSINDIVLKNSYLITGPPKYTGSDVLVKSVEFKVPLIDKENF